MSHYVSTQAISMYKTGLDVALDNIANIGTLAHKGRRIDYETEIAQFRRGATAPQGGMGGQNDLSIGMGARIGGIKKMMDLQGPLRSTKSETDLAFEEDGWFVVSDDGGLTKKYTRAGNFSFDTAGNLTNNNGYIIQGWSKDITSKDTNCENEDSSLYVASTGPIRNIVIESGLTMPAKKTSEITLNANLNTGNTVKEKKCIYQLDSSSSTIAGTQEAGYTYQYDDEGNIQEREEDMGVLFNDSGQALNLTENQGIWISYKTAQITTDVINGAGSITINGKKINITNGTAPDAATAINAESGNTGVTAIANIDGTLTLTNLNDDTIAKHKNIRISESTVDGIEITDSTARGNLGIGAAFTAYNYQYHKNDTAITDDITAKTMGVKFNTTEELRRQMQLHANMVKNGSYQDAAASVKVTVNQFGRFEVINNHDNDTTTSIPLNLNVTSYTGDSMSSVSENTLLSATFSALNTTLTEGSGASASTASLHAASHEKSIDVFDSLGSQHTVQFEFRKIDGKQWSWRVRVPEPGNLVGHPADASGNSIKKNVYENGTVTFNSDGSLKGFNPPVISYDPGNGAKAPQLLRLDFGKANTFTGISSTDSVTRSDIGQNGYGAGSLQRIRIDSTGTIIGKFDNGRSIGLAKVAVATFANNEGLESEGGSLSVESPNSGSANIGVAGIGNRSKVRSGFLEMSNIEMSKALSTMIREQNSVIVNSKGFQTEQKVLETLINKLG
jgi:flagellar hook protein FlgE